MKSTFFHRPPTSGVHLLNDPDPEWMRPGEQTEAVSETASKAAVAPLPQRSTRAITLKTRRTRRAK